jgi:ribose-phosphate pyrophosphokinase
MDLQPVVILANKKGKAWDFAEKIYNNLNSRPDRQRRYKLGEVEILKFNDGELFVKVLENVRSKQCYFIHDSSVNPQDWLVSLGLVNDALRRSSASEVNNVLPYMKFSRQDRMTEPRTPISSSFVADIINRSADRVLTSDLHNPATEGSYRIPFDNLKAFPTMIKYLRERFSDIIDSAIIVAPDAGSAKRAESYAKRLNLDVAIAHKKREAAGQIGDMTIIGEVRDKNAIIVDDLIDTGGTLCKAADVLIQKGAKNVYACATHGLLSLDAKEKIGCSLFEKVVCGNTIPQEFEGKIEVVDISSLFAEAIFRITHGASISELFKK